MRKIHIAALAFSFLFSVNQVMAQPANDNCNAATVLADVDNYCSGNGEFTNVNATLSGTAQPFCFPDVTSDVWFTFTAVATTLHVTVIGATNNPNIPSGGTLQNPQFAIYSGNCASLNEIACASDGFGANIIESFAGPLTVGQTYFIRVDGRSGNTGTFRLCVNNFNAVPEPSGDCPTGVILCDKSSFTVESLIGTGSQSNEIDPGLCIGQEFASAWYRWTCDQPGTLTFTITPTNPSDDIDFAIFELPGGIDDCSNKEMLRCEAAGENVGEPFSCWEPCTGPTGLNSTETDQVELPGCGANCSQINNNFVSEIVMEVGASYALIINNFSNTGNGFTIEWGGTGTFLGPTADFTSTPDNSGCLNEAIVFQDNSQSIAGVASWEWNFGVGANPATASGPGPHEVTYSTPGIKSVTLVIEDESGCIVTSIQQYEVFDLPTVDLEIIADYCGPQDNTGQIIISPTGGATPYQYDWGPTGIFTSDSSMMDLATGIYTVVVQDANGCTALLTPEIEEGLSLAAGIDPVQPPTCNGDSDGSISVTVEISNPPVTYDFGNGPQASNTLDNVSAGTITVHVVDGQGCEGFFTIVVEDYPPLELGIDPLDISCFGENDGTTTALPMGGEGTYTYLWDNGETTQTIENLSAGPYTVTVTDGNGCTSVTQADIIEPPEIIATAEVEDILCAGDATGTITVDAEGGTPPFEYSVNGTDFQPDPQLSDLPAGSYTVTVRDSRGCEFTLDAFIDEPLPLVVDAGPDQTIDLGFTADIRAQTLPLFRPVTITWNPSETLDCGDCDDPVASPFETTTYTIQIIDEDGCMAEDQLTIFVNVIRPVYIPNVFSPNGDGINDFFTVYGGPAVSSILKLRVYDRWGELVFDGQNFPPNDEPSGWDGTFKGKPMNSAVFAYYAEVEFIDGVVILYEGDVTLLR